MDLNISDGVKLSAQLVMTGRGCIIGQSGSGKSFLMGIVAEELGKLGLPFCIIDTEGEYSSLKAELPNLLIVGGDAGDLPITVNMEKLFLSSITDSIPMVLDVSDVVQKQELVYKALSTLYAIEENSRKPFLVLIEEADKFAPQIVHQKINIIEELSVRGRKRGIGLLIATQRPSNISKNVLSQCSYGFIGKLTIENDLNAISQLFSNRTALDEIVNLDTGEFMPFGQAQKERFKVKSRLSFHMGSTPQIKESLTANNVNMQNLINELSIQKPSQAKSSEFIEKKRDKNIKQITAEVAISEFSEETISEYANKLAKKTFGIFGKKKESLDNIKKVFIPITFFVIHVPTKKKREFDEYTIPLNGDGLPILLNNKIIIKNMPFKYSKLTDLEEEVLGFLRSKGHIKKNILLNNYPGKVRSISAILQRLIARKLITLKNNTLYAERYTNLNNKPILQSNKEKINSSDLINEPISSEHASLSLKTLFPTCIIKEQSTILIPIYEITLRNKNKLRIFKIDGIFGKELSHI